MRSFVAILLISCVLPLSPMSQAEACGGSYGTQTAVPGERLVVQRLVDRRPPRAVERLFVPWQTSEASRFSRSPNWSRLDPTRFVSAEIIERDLPTPRRLVLTGPDGQRVVRATKIAWLRSSPRGPVQLGFVIDADARTFTHATIET